MEKPFEKAQKRYNDLLDESNDVNFLSGQRFIAKCILLIIYILLYNYDKK